MPGEYDSLVSWLWDNLEVTAALNRLETTIDRSKERAPFRALVSDKVGEINVPMIEALMLASFCLGLAVREGS